MAKPIVVCKECGKEKRHHAKGYCDACYNRLLYQKNPENRRKYIAEWREKNKKKWLEWTNTNYAKNRERRHEAHKKYREANREKRREYTRKWIAENPEYGKQWLQDNPERAKERRENWAQRNNEKLRTYRQKRRAAVNGNGGSYTPEEWNRLVEITGNKCLACGVSGKIELLTVDHIVPVSKGGTSNIDNLQPLCHSCNSSKGTNEINYLEAQ